MVSFFFFEKLFQLSTNLIIRFSFYWKSKYTKNDSISRKNTELGWVFIAYDTSHHRSVSSVEILLVGLLLALSVLDVTLRIHSTILGTPQVALRDPCFSKGSLLEISFSASKSSQNLKNQGDVYIQFVIYSHRFSYHRLIQR